MAEEMDRWRQGGTIGRRRLLAYLSALSAGTVLRSAVASAAPQGEPPPPSALSPAGTQLPDTQEGAHRSEEQLIQACVSRGNWLPSDIPTRSPDEAVASCLARRESQQERGAAPAPSPLGQLLAGTPLSESRLGLNNWPILEESEELELGHFRFAISPYTAFVDDGKQRFLLFANSPLAGGFRSSDYLEDVQRRMFDRAVWMMANGCRGAAVVEFDRPLSAARVGHTVRALYDFGVRTIIWGNEPNDPGASWRDNLPELVKIFSAAADTRKQYGLDDLELSLPGMAYFGQGEYLQKLLGTFDALLPGWSGGSSKYLPFQRVADHYYGPVDGFLQRLTEMRQIMAKVGLNDLKFDLAEVGNPTANTGQPATDQQLAEGYIPQIASLAVASGMMDRLYYYSALDGGADQYSLAGIKDGGLVLKPSYHAFVTMARLLSRISGISWSETAETMRVDGSRTDGIEFTVVWSKATDRDVAVPLPPGRRVFDALGSEVKGPDPQQVVLSPRGHPALAGPARILFSVRS